MPASHAPRRTRRSGWISTSELIAVGNENDLVGTYCVNRATAPKDRASQCEDVSKGVAIIERSKSTVFGTDFLEAATHLKVGAGD